MNRLEAIKNFFKPRAIDQTIPLLPINKAEMPMPESINSRPPLKRILRTINPEDIMLEQERRSSLGLRPLGPITRH